MSIRFATFNASLFRDKPGALGAELAQPGAPQADGVAEIIQRTRPDVLLVNEFDYDPQAVARFQEHYLGAAHGSAEPVHYPYAYSAPSNTGIPSGFDLDRDGELGGPGDALGFGLFPGQYGMVVFSMLPIDRRRVRTFQHFLWKDMPGALLPLNPAAPAPNGRYSLEELAVLRLSSKSHWDIPLRVGRQTVHFLASHPTPPVFDDPLFREHGRRNHDEIRFWADYISPSRSGYISDDLGTTGGLDPGALFVIAGDQNADPFDGRSVPGAIQQLLDHPLVNGSATPASAGGVEAAWQRALNQNHRGDPAFHTAAFGDSAGNLRVDYVLPHKRLQVTDAGVFWPEAADEHGGLVNVSDHRLVWIDVLVPGE